MDIKDSYYSYVSFPQKAEQAKEDYLNPERDYRYYELPMWTSNIEFGLRYIDDVVKKNIPFMTDWYQCIQTIEDVIDELDKQIAMPSPYNHRNKYYTKAFLLAKIKCIDEAVATMCQIYHPHEIPPEVIEKLYQASQLE